MSDTKVDYKKLYSDLYYPQKSPSLIQIPRMNFVMVDGAGVPGPESEEYQKAMQLLYSISFTIKMSKMTGDQPKGYFEYVVPPLEGLYSCGKEPFDFAKPQQWTWTSMIRQPEFVTKDVYDWAITKAVAKAEDKGKDIDYSKARYSEYEEGLCVQMMHIGPYSNEQITIDEIFRFIEENCLKVDYGPERKHHEIYLSDPRKSKPENLKTVIRYPVKRG
jgi:hypothetical protein